MNIGATGENSAKLVVSQSYLGTVFSISSPFRLPLVKKGKIFPMKLWKFEYMGFILPSMHLSDLSEVASLVATWSLVNVLCTA